MPSPRKDETRSQFIGRCMADEESIEDFPKRDQRFAVCNSLWEQSRKKSKKVKKHDSERDTAQQPVD